MDRFIDLTGLKFGKLIVFERVANDKWGQARWLCKCECNKEAIVTGYSLRSSRIKSCGCLVLKHGHTKNKKQSRTYKSWDSMNQRCTNPNNASYKYYGDRGIKICYRWSDKNPKGFENFLKDMSECTKGLTLDRIDNNSDYEPNNCRWATPKEQANNRSNNINVPFNNGFLCLWDYCKIKNLNYQTIAKRINKYGYTIEQALITPIRKGKKINEK